MDTEPQSQQQVPQETPVVNVPGSVPKESRPPWWLLILFLLLLASVVVLLVLLLKQKSASTSNTKMKEEMSLEKNLKAFKPDIHGYMEQAADGIFVIHGVYTGKTKENLPLYDGDELLVGTSELALELAILDAVGYPQTFYLPWIIQDVNGRYYYVGYNEETTKTFGTKEEAFDYWTKYGNQKAGIVAGRVITFNLAPDTKTDTGPGDPLYDNGVFDYWKGREKQLTRFFNTGDAIGSGLSIVLGTNIRLGETAKF